MAKRQLERLGFKVRLRAVPQDAVYTEWCQVPRKKVHKATVRQAPPIPFLWDETALIWSKDVIGQANPSRCSWRSDTSTPRSPATEAPVYPSPDAAFHR